MFPDLLLGPSYLQPLGVGELRGVRLQLPVAKGLLHILDPAYVVSLFSINLPAEIVQIVIITFVFLIHLPALLTNFPHCIHELLAVEALLEPDLLHQWPILGHLLHHLVELRIHAFSL